MTGKPLALLIAAALMAAHGVAAGAQTAAAPPPSGEPRGSHHSSRMFGDVSPEGRAILRQAMREQASPDDRQKLRDARDRVAAILVTERLDPATLKRAMDAERQLVEAQQVRRQSAMLAAFQKLSWADRKAFAEDARRGRAGIEARTRDWREQPADRGRRASGKIPPQDQ